MYNFIIVVVKVLVGLIHGKIEVKNKQNIPSEQFILVAPHRTWWDPVWYALTTLPMKYIFMAKAELFNFKPMGWFIKSLGAFPVDRDNPGPSAIKIPVKELKTGSRSLIIFPSGSRHSTELATGAIVIAKLSGKKILPAVYQGPVKFSGLFKRHSSTIAIGKPIEVGKTDDNKLIIERIENSFAQLDKSIDPNWVYIDPKEKKKK